MYVGLPHREETDAGLYNEGQTEVISVQLYVYRPILMYMFTNICGFEYTTF